MTPMRFRHKYELPLGNWGSNPIGKAYIHLHPHRKFLYFSEKTMVKNGKEVVKHLPIPMVNGVFPKGIFTINFHNGYHLDPNDRDCLTHCTVTTPNNFLDESDYVGGTFCLGTAVFDYTEVNINIIFWAVM